jgi:hypothetical protein
MPNIQQQLFISKPRIKGGAVIALRPNLENQYGTITRTGSTLRLHACVSRGGVSIKKRNQTVTYPTVRYAKEILTQMVGQDCEAMLPESE